MFIRTINKKLKDGKISTTYQAVQTFRKDGKVKHKVISLGRHNNPRDALAEELRFLERMRKDLEIPISEYKEVRALRGIYVDIVKVPEKVAEKRRNILVARCERQIQRVATLESVVSKFRHG